MGYREEWIDWSRASLRRPAFAVALGGVIRRKALAGSPAPPGRAVASELAGRGPRGSTAAPWWVRPLRWGVTLGLIAYLVWVVDLGALARTLVSVDPALLAAGVLVAFFDRGVMAFKWFVLLRVQDPSITLGRAVRAYLAAGFGALVIPTPVTGDVLRAMALGRGGDALARIGASIVVERLLGMMASALLCLIALQVALELSDALAFLVPWVGAFLAATTLAFLLPLGRFGSRAFELLEGRFTPRAVRGLSRRFATAYAMYGDARGTLAGVALLTLFEQTLPILNLWVLALALDLPIGPTALVVAVPLSVFVARLPISIAGLGVGESALVYLLGLLGVPAYQALALGLLGTAMNLVVAIPGVFLWREVTSRRREV